MKDDELLDLITLSLIPDIGSVLIRTLLQHFGSAGQVLIARPYELARIEGIGKARALAIAKQDVRSLAEQELTKIRQQGILPISINDAAFPEKLRNCFDAPVLLYTKGKLPIHHHRVVSIVGSRMFTAYGKQITETIVKELAAHQVVIVSGMAHGIDAIAHRAALQNQVPTMGVMAHGFGTIYPPHHASLAHDMLHYGVLITEFCFHAKPDKHHFPKRNRIVAGIADATIVIETAVKGGSMITAELAFGYDRDVFSVPGKLTDPRSQGCLQLIAQNKSAPFTSTAAFIEAMGWSQARDMATAHKKIPLLAPDEQVLVSTLLKAGTLHIDEWQIAAGLPRNLFAAALLELELQGIVNSLPGKRYQCQ